MNSESALVKLFDYVVEKGVSGVGPLVSAKDLAEEYLDDYSYLSKEEIARKLVNYQAVKTFTASFVISLPGPFTIPVSISGAYVTQARMIAAIGFIFGYDLKCDKVRATIRATLVGVKIRDFVREMARKSGEQFLFKTIQSIPGSILIEVNKQLGFRFITKAGSTGVINLKKAVPLIGAMMGASVDTYFCKATGKLAIQNFSN